MKKSSTATQGKIGSYAIATIDAALWMNEHAKEQKEKPKKSQKNREVVNRIFTECASVIDDPFWIDKFNNAARGKFPQKFCYNNGTLIYRKGSKPPSVEVPNDNIEAAYICMEFFKKYGGIFSPMDAQNSIDIHDEIDNNGYIDPLTWDTANKKVRDALISYYVLALKSNMTLNDFESKQLRQTINLGIINKFFGKENIIVDNNRIKSIGGLLWNDVDRRFTIDASLKQQQARNYTKSKNKDKIEVDQSNRDTYPQFGLKWAKYIDSLDKKIIKEKRKQNRIIIDHSRKTRSIDSITSSDCDTNLTTDNTTDNYDY